MCRPPSQRGQPRRFLTQMDLLIASSRASYSIISLRNKRCKLLKKSIVSSNRQAPFALQTGGKPRVCGCVWLSLECNSLTDFPPLPRMWQELCPGSSRKQALSRYDSEHHTRRCLERLPSSRQRKLETQFILCSRLFLLLVLGASASLEEAWIG